MGRRCPLHEPFLDGQGLRIKQRGQHDLQVLKIFRGIDIDIDRDAGGIGQLQIARDLFIRLDQTVGRSASGKGGELDPVMGAGSGLLSHLVGGRAADRQCL